MGFFNHFPYTNFHELNLDWLLSQMKKLDEDFNTFVETNIIKYADPIAWTITSQYEPNTIVSNGTDVYLSKQAVPAGVAITNTDYWFQVGDLSTYQLQLDTLRHQIASDDEGTNVTASQAYSTDDVFWLNGYLSQATQNINAGETFAYGVNYDRVTVLDLLDDLNTDLSNDISTINGDINTINGNITAINNKLGNTAGLRKRIICIGDSIAQGYNPDGNVTGWPEYVRQKLGLTANVDFFENALGGAGFWSNSSGKDFLDLITDLTPSVTSPDTITDIYIVGGVNDVQNNGSYNNVKNGTQSVCNYCKTTFPNAKIHVGCIAYYQKAGYNKASALMDIHSAVKAGCAGSAEIIPGIIAAMSKYTRYASDGLHVGQECENLIAECITSNSGPLFRVSLSGTAESGVSGLPQMTMEVNGDIIRAWIGASTLNFTGNLVNGNTGSFKIGTVTESALLGYGYGTNVSNFQLIPFRGMAHINGGNYVLCQGTISICNGEVYLQVLALNSGGTNFAGYLNSIAITSDCVTIPVI